MSATPLHASWPLRLMGLCAAALCSASVMAGEPSDTQGPPTRIDVGQEAGLYQMGNGELACLKSNGTWKGVSYQPWEGRWQRQGQRIYMAGNFWWGIGSDSMIFSTRGHGDTYLGTWTEWTNDGLTFIVEPRTFTVRLSDHCRTAQALGRADADTSLTPLARKPLPAAVRRR